MIAMLTWVFNLPLTLVLFKQDRWQLVQIQERLLVPSHLYDLLTQQASQLLSGNNIHQGRTMNKLSRYHYFGGVEQHIYCL
jgi:hypothetical protein